jgi:[ribosomal protein S5]-alanine N-acetyltransferase
MSLKDVVGEFPVLETERLLLRELRPEDAQPRFEMLQAPDILKYIPWTAPETVEACSETVIKLRDQFHDDESLGLNWAITLKADGEFIGCMKYWKWFGHENRIAELGYELAKPHWNRGYMTEAMVAAVHCGFERCNLMRCQLTIDSRNGASARVAEKAGFKLEGTLRKFAYLAKRQEWYDLLMLSITRDEWLAGA